MNNLQKKPRLQTSRGFCIFIFALVGDGALDIPKANEYKLINPLPVILSAVELLRVERKRTSKSASHKAKRDLVTSLGDFLMGCNIHFGKPPKFVRRSLRRYRSSVLYRYSLNKTSTSLRMTYGGIVCCMLKKEISELPLTPPQQYKSYLN